MIISNKNFKCMPRIYFYCPSVHIYLFFTLTIYHDQAKWKPIHTAAAYRRVDILNILIQRGVELNCANNVSLPLL